MREGERELARELREQFDALHIEWMQKQIAWAECKRLGVENAARKANARLAELCGEWGRICH